MDKEIDTVYEKNFHVSVDPASPNGGKCVKVYWRFRENGEPEIISMEELPPKKLTSL